MQVELLQGGAVHAREVPLQGNAHASLSWMQTVEQLHAEKERLQEELRLVQQRLCSIEHPQVSF